jgi:adenine phosphoribosyltransferase
MDYAALIRDIPDYPKPGIVFKDLTGLWKDPAALTGSARELADHFRDQGITKVIGAEARGFIPGVLVAAELGAGFIPVRKPGKLPWKTVSESYALEYGTDTLQMHADAVSPGDRVLLVDDLVATGGTLNAIMRLVRSCGGEAVGIACLVELAFLNPAEKLDLPIFSLIRY